MSQSATAVRTAVLNKLLKIQKTAISVEGMQGQLTFKVDCKEKVFDTVIESLKDLNIFPSVGNNFEVREGLNVKIILE